MKKAGFGAEVSVDGRFLEVRPAQRLRYTWRWEGAFDGMADTLVTVEFIGLAGGTELYCALRILIMSKPDSSTGSGEISACNRLERSLPGA